MKTERRLEWYIDRELLPNRAGLRRAIAPPADPLAAGLLDSLAIEQLIAFANEEFGIAITDDELTVEHFASLAAFTAFVDAKRSARTMR